MGSVRVNVLPASWVSKKPCRWRAPVSRLATYAGCKVWSEGMRYTTWTLRELVPSVLPLPKLKSSKRYVSGLGKLRVSVKRKSEYEPEPSALTTAGGTVKSRVW